VKRQSDFPGRLAQACDRNPNIAPEGQGRQADLARAIGVSFEAVSKWFRGETTPRRDKIAALARLLGVDEAWLAIGNAPEFDSPRARALSTCAPWRAPPTWRMGLA